MQTIRRFFLKDAQSIENLVEIFNTFSLYFGLKPNLTKCEIAGIGALKRVQGTVVGEKFCYWLFWIDYLTRY